MYTLTLYPKPGINYYYLKDSEGFYFKCDLSKPNGLGSKTKNKSEAIKFSLEIAECLKNTIQQYLVLESTE